MHLHQGHRPSLPTSASTSCTVAPAARRFLAFLVGLGDGPRCRAPSCRSDPRAQAATWALFLCHAEGTEPTRGPSTWASTCWISPDLGDRLQTVFRAASPPPR